MSNILAEYYLCTCSRLQHIKLSFSFNSNRPSTVSATLGLLTRFSRIWLVTGEKKKGNKIHMKKRYGMQLQQAANYKAFPILFSQLPWLSVVKDRKRPVNLFEEILSLSSSSC
jgi:hypothetical protein